MFSAVAVASPDIKLIINGKEIETDVPPQMINGRVMVPARFVAEPLGATVEWKDNTVIITKKTLTEKPQNDSTNWVALRETAKKQGWTVNGDGFVYQNGNKLFDWKEVGQIVDGIIYIPADILNRFVLP
ncbi:MAG: copper amine oxidase N-terminal domain-containing protein [Bacillota bacterium]